MKKLLLLTSIVVLFGCSDQTNNSQTEQNEAIEEIETNEPIAEAADENKEKTTEPIKDNSLYVLADVLNVRSGPSLNDEVVTKAKFGDQLTDLEETGKEYIKITWQGFPYNEKMRKVKLSNGTIGWAYSAMIGDQDKLKAHQSAINLRKEFPKLSDYEGFNVDLEMNNGNPFVWELCECSELGLVVYFHYRGYLLEKPQIMILECGAGYPIDVDKVESTTYNGQPAIKATGKSGSTKASIILYKTKEADYQVTNYILNTSKTTRQTLNYKYRDKVDTKQEDCEGLYDGY